MKSMLDKKFCHSVWYIGADLTWKDFLELAAESHSFYVTKRIARKQSDNLLDDLVYDVILKDEENRGSIRLNEEQLAYFEKRREFWRMFDEDFWKCFPELHGTCDYWDKKREAKMQIKEYAEALKKVRC